PPRDLHAFPTRRSSDLQQRGQLRDREDEDQVEEQLDGGDPDLLACWFGAAHRSHGRDAKERAHRAARRAGAPDGGGPSYSPAWRDRKSTRLNSSHRTIS